MNELLEKYAARVIYGSIAAAFLGGAVLVAVLYWIFA
jgi:hypothetical protein